MKTIRQSLTLLRQHPLLSTISILGTALAITMIMAIVITWQTKYADIEPEVNRNRCLYYGAVHMQGKENKNYNNYGMASVPLMKECIRPVPEVEACTAYSKTSVALVSLTDGGNRLKVDAMDTDSGFWKVFRLHFLCGQGFEEANRGGGARTVVIAASVARRLFGTTDAVGKRLLLNREEARVCGVVKDVSVTAKDAYAQVWCLYGSEKMFVRSETDYSGGMSIAVLARSKDDFAAIRQGVDKRVQALNVGLKNWQVDLMDQPDNVVAHVNRAWMNVGPDLKMLYLQYAVALLIILLVPSLNLCGLSNSRMQQRMSELGVRKAFGATRGVLMRQVLDENLVLTLLGGVAGLLLSYASVFCMRTWLFSNSDNIGTSGDFSLSMSALFSPTVFCLAFLFCLVINLLSAGLPAYMAARRNIVDSLSDRI